MSLRAFKVKSSVKVMCLSNYPTFKNSGKHHLLGSAGKGFRGIRTMRSDRQSSSHRRKAMKEIHNIVSKAETDALETLLMFVR